MADPGHNSVHLGQRDTVQIAKRGDQNYSESESVTRANGMPSRGFDRVVRSTYVLGMPHGFSYDFES